MYGFTFHLPTDVLSDELLVKLSHDLATLTPQKIEYLGVALGYTRAEVKQEMSQYNTVQEFILSMMETWNNSYSLPSKEKLAQALAKCGLDFTQIVEHHTISEFAHVSLLQFLHICPLFQVTTYQLYSHLSVMRKYVKYLTMLKTAPNLRSGC